MTTFLFIWTVLAGGTSMSGQHTYGGLNWKAQWVNAGQFQSPEACHKAAASLTIPKTEYRCLSATYGDVR